MTFIPMFLRDVPASVYGFPVPSVGCCCSAPYHQNSLPLGPVRGALFPNIDVNHRTADGLRIQSSAISGAAAEVKSP